MRFIICFVSFLLCTNIFASDGTSYWDIIDSMSKDITISVDIVGTIDGSQPCWSIDGKKLYYRVEKKEERYGGTTGGMYGSITRNLIMVYDLSTQKSSTLFSRRGKSFDSPSTSPDGNFIAYKIRDDNGGSVWRYDFSTKKANKISKYYESMTGPTWSPDGKNIAFCALMRPTWRLIIIDLETGVERVITGENRHAESAIWGVDDWIYCNVGTKRFVSPICKISPNTGHIEELESIAESCTPGASLSDHILLVEWSNRLLHRSFGVKLLFNCKSWSDIRIDGEEHLFRLLPSPHLEHVAMTVRGSDDWVLRIGKVKNIKSK